MPTAAKKTSKKKAAKKTAKKAAAKKTASKKAASKKTTKKAAAKARPALKMDGVPDQYVSRLADDTLYDRRRGRPGTYKALIANLVAGEKGATREQCCNAAIKAGIYEDSDDGFDAAHYQFGMHINGFKRDSEKGVKVEKLDEETYRWKVTFSKR